MTKANPDFATTLAAQLPGYARRADSEAICVMLADTAACVLGAEGMARSGDSIVSRIAGPSTAGGSGSDTATVWFSGERLPVEAAAFRNAVAARYLDFNDTYVGRSIVHPSDMISAIVALAESRAVAWPRLIEAVGVAYETLARLADAADLKSHGCDPATLIPVATAAGCAWLLGLNAARTANAIRTAALDSAILRCIRGEEISEWKAVAAARASVKGLFAVRMAEAGIVAPDQVFEAKDGFFAHVSGTMSIAEDAEPRSSRTLVKCFPAQIFLQAPLTLAQDMAAKLSGRRADGIASVELTTFRQAVDIVGGRTGGDGALNRESADHSAAFCIAAMLLRGRLGYADIDAFLKDREINVLMQRIAVTDGGETMAGYPRRLPARLEVRLSNGSVIKAEAHDNPRVTRARLADKVTGLWPSQRPLAWPWACPGAAPDFPC